MSAFLLEHRLEHGEEDNPWGETPPSWEEYCRLHDSVATSDPTQSNGWHFAMIQKRSKLKIPIWFSITPRFDACPVDRLPESTSRWLAFFDSGNDFTLSLAERHLLNFDLSLFFTDEAKQDFGFNPMTFFRRNQDERVEWQRRSLTVRDSSGRRSQTYRLLVDFWIHPSRESPSSSALRINTGGADGISVYLPEWDDGREIAKDGRFTPPKSGQEKEAIKRLGPPFPLIGMRALERAKLALTISYNTSPGLVTISS